MLTQDRLKELVEYSPDTGEFRYAKSRKGSKYRAGDLLGSLTSVGYMQAQLDGKRYFLHRLAVLYMTGETPSQVVDHINRDKADNRWENLRCTTQQNNCHNQSRAAANNSTGHVGVHRWGGKYRAKINVGKKQMHLGTFDDPAAAAAAYASAKAALLPSMEG